MRPVKETTFVVAPRACRRPGCALLGDYARELCEKHYRATAKYVEDGVITWAKLERQGKVAAPKPTLKDWLLS